MWVSKEHYNWLLNGHVHERVDAVRKEKDLLITKQQTENYMLYEKVGELNVLLLRTEKRLADVEWRYIAFVEELVKDRTGPRTDSVPASKP